MPQDHHQEQRRDRRRVDFDRAIHNMMAAAAARAGAVPSATAAVGDHHRRHRTYLTSGHQSSDATSTSLVDIINQALDIARRSDIDCLSYAHAGPGVTSDSVSASEDLGSVLLTSTEPNSNNSSVGEDETESGVTSDDGDDDVDGNAREE
eukprot:CAMPEP_0113466022 /NCGR_PEP_ID=MMETSP0014_2-20120614/14049_1 /TAXON_ID=2857 /ORGANISM="Nitzschia sp." /LENGTH=149 /DNA_ID=CAMNT_0000358215 /DNA_START=204 /DNA_END=653 /DNA_ORIENTATION=- /assembly_acc=CAM_ASM_000159